MRRGETEAPNPSRRRYLAGALAALAGAVSGAQPIALPEAGAAAMREILAGRVPVEGRVRLELPGLAENGRSVPLKVSVDSPMSPGDHVRTVHLVAPANPNPILARLHFGPRSGEAFLRTRIRLADSQEVLAIAEMSDGSVWAGRARVVVTLGGCLEPLL